MTLSIVARCSKSGDLGACTITANLAVGNRVPHVESNVGAICTQAHTNVSYGIKGLNASPILICAEMLPLLCAKPCCS